MLKLHASCWRRSIVELCEADHRNDAQFLANWLANKTPENVVAWIENPDNVVYVALIESRISGVAAIQRNGRISLNYVSPDARFKGVSKALLAQLELKASEWGLSTCTLESTVTALAFYTSAGYRQRDDASRPGVAMSRALA